MRTNQLIEAFQLPTVSMVGQRVPRKMLLEQGALTDSDKRHFQEGVKDLVWVAEIKPSHIGVPAFKDAVREYGTLALVSVTFDEAAKVAHLTDLIHRAIPYPLVLLGTRQKNVTLSLAHKHDATHRVGGVALEGVDMSATFGDDDPNAMESAFLASLAVTAQPATDFFALYQGWLDRVQALAAARISGRFALLEDVRERAARRDALVAHGRLLHSLEKLRGQLAKEKQRDRLAKMRLVVEAQEAQLTELVAGL